MGQETLEHDKLLAWVNGNEAAAGFLRGLGELSQIADDFVDDDKPMDKSRDMTRLLHLALVVMPNNPFFKEYAGYLAPVLETAFQCWHLSNWQAEQADKTTRMFAFVGRETLEHVIVQAAFLIGGFDHAAAVARDVHDFYHGPDSGQETFGQWSKT